MGELGWSLGVAQVWKGLAGAALSACDQGPGEPQAEATNPASILTLPALVQTSLSGEAAQTALPRPSVSRPLKRVLHPAQAEG